MAEINEAPKKKLAIEPWMFGISIVLLLILSVFLMFRPSQGNKALTAGYNVLTGPFGWIYSWYALIVFCLVIYFIFGKYGKMRLGKEKPEFSTFTWLTLLFTSATGCGLLYWSTAEYFFYVQAPPFGVKAFTLTAQEWASAYGPFHWGVVTNAMFSLAAIMFGYIIYVKKIDIFRPSIACKALLGDRVNGWLGKVIDVCFMLGVVAAVVTSIGLAVPITGDLVAKIFGIKHTLTMDGILIVIWTIIIALCVYTGLQKGIKYMSLTRIWVSIAILAFVMIVGPTAFMLNNFTQATGHILEHFFKMVMYTDPLKITGFPQAWTIFYYAWYITFEVYVGVYYARISRGRTVAQVCLGIIGATSLGGWAFFAVIGNYGTYLYNHGVPIIKVMTEQGTSAGIVYVWSHLPLQTVTLLAFLVLAFVSCVTMLNGGAYTCAMVTTKTLRGDEEPAGLNRVFWAAVIGLVTFALMFVGGLKPLQMFTIVASAPLMVISVLMTIAFFKDTKKGWDEEHLWEEKPPGELEESPVLEPSMGGVLEETTVR